jgi:hypothetical protein
VFSQKRLDLVHDNAFAFYDYQEKAFCVLDDSTFLWKYNAKKEKWEKSPIDLKLEIPFTTFLTDFIVMSDQGTPVYFVFKGCGVVYAKKRNEIFRHDHSFYHMNQFDGAFFMDDGEPRIYGGYGLFTYKDIITRYDTIEREWFMMTTKKGGPPAGIKNLVQSNIKNTYFVLDGLKNVNGHLFQFEHVWRLDLKTKKWSNLGKLNPRINGIKMELVHESFQTLNTEFNCFSNMFVSYDFENMRYRKYMMNNTKLFKKILKIGTLILVCKTTSKPSRYIEILDRTFLDQLEYEDGDIVLNETNEFSKFIFLFLIFIITVFVFTRNRMKQKVKNKFKPNSFSMSDEFNQAELELLQLLFNNKERGLEISYINDLVNYDNPTIDTIKKRREILLKDLRYKLSSKFNIPQEGVFIERRMETDKRMKLLFLNKLVKIKI